MAYIDSAYYLTYSGKAAPSDFAQLSELASNLIDALCGYQIGLELDLLDVGIVSRIKQATAAQVAFSSDQGGMAAILSGSEAVQSASVGKFSYTLGGNGSSSGVLAGFAGVKLSPLIEMILFPTGLLYRGVVVC